MFDNINLLEYLDLSNNYFTGSIPLAFGKIYKLLRIAYLNNNEFSGNIPSIIEQFTELDELILHQNELTGSLLSQIGKFVNVSKTCSANLFNYTINSFITDCGRNEMSPGLVDCVNCAECCNVDGFLEN